MPKRPPTKARPSAPKSKSRDRGHEDGEPRSHEIWKGTLSFGLVEIPVGLVSAENVKEEVRLSYLDRRDFSPVGYTRYNKVTNAEVPWSEIVHGFEYEKGEYVALSKEDLERASPELTKTIGIVEFVAAEAIEPIYFEKPYYLSPLKERSKGYVLLRDVLERTGKVGIAKIAIRTREHVAAVGVRGPALTLHLLRFAAELRSPNQVARVGAGVKDVGVTAREREMAEQLVADMTGEWRPERFRDDYAADLKRMIDKKIASGKVHAMATEPAPQARRARGDVIDLMPLLKRSVEAARSGRGGRTRGGVRSA